MALLLAKRRVAELSKGESLTILVADSGAKQDIPRYLHTVVSSVQVQHDVEGIMSIFIIK
ncbi:sulfurtransferase TusA family protein [Vibrio sp. SS-MA-C1-2]|uniref:sulfurtransferase TusA family protein n=1 Tax=Vibrio sp. SS-MA-C1-2 TaxID=2908646 RepID=UPI001F365615|nr:sulfurtransferase TusA family protein [Vibrio sp. SS-MA-C1-2]